MQSHHLPLQTLHIYLNYLHFVLDAGWPDLHWLRYAGTNLLLTHPAHPQVSRHYHHQKNLSSSSHSSSDQLYHHFGFQAHLAAYSGFNSRELRELQSWALLDSPIFAARLATLFGRLSWHQSLEIAPQSSPETHFTIRMLASLPLYTLTWIYFI